MVAALSDFQGLIHAAPSHPIYQAMLAVDPARPPAAQVIFERFGLTNPAELLSLALSDQGVHPT
jgi:hypothetical protein